MTAIDQIELARVADSGAGSGRGGVTVAVHKVVRRFGERRVLDGLSIDLRAGEFTAIVGKSGCGKSTLLRLLAGLDGADGGTITVDGRPLAGLSEDVRIMYQDARLLPWQSVVNNVALGLSGPRTVVRARALEALDQVGLADRADEWPSRLSGGQRQRVALARAIAFDPELLVLQDPTTAVDSVTEQNIAEQVSRHRAGKITLIFSEAPAWNAVAANHLSAEDLKATTEELLAGATV